MKAPVTLTNLFYREFFADPVLRAFYGNSGHANLGYWDETTPDAAAAGNRLVDVLCHLIPVNGGSVLEVACGHGATTRRLAYHFGGSALTAIGTSRAQLEHAQRLAPECKFCHMSPTELGWQDESFDIVCCIEAAFHFCTREQFLLEARRVLKPGGCLALSDLLMTWGTPLVPAENYLASLRGYERLLERCGFANIVVVDVTEQTWRAFRRRLTGFLLESPSRYMSPVGMRDLMAANTACAFAIRSSLLAASRRA